METSINQLNGSAALQIAADLVGHINQILETQANMVVIIQSLENRVEELEKEIISINKKAKE